MKKWQTDMNNLAVWLTTEEGTLRGMEITRDLWEIQGPHFQTIYAREPALIALARMPSGKVQTLNPYLLCTCNRFWEVKFLLPDAPRLSLVFGQASDARLAWALRLGDYAAPLTLPSGERDVKAWARLQAWLQDNATGQAAGKMMSLALDAQPPSPSQPPVQAAQIALWGSP
mgnify:CR=1 FL=1